MNKVKSVIGLVCLLLSLLNVNELISQRTYRKITTREYQEKPELNNAQTKSNRALIEKHTNEFKKESKFKKVTLPIVFHILFKPGSSYPDQAQVLNQIESLNRDFGIKAYRIKHTADTLLNYKDKAADTEIQFCLASLDPGGKTTNGLNFIPSNSSNWGLKDDIKSSRKAGADPWDVTKYINIWIADLGSETSGYAQMPGGPAATDGIVIDAKYFSSKSSDQGEYNEGKTLTHLMGNYLNLYDLWGPCFCCDDGVEDTPIHNAPNYGKTDEYRHLSTCDGYSVELSMNFMDNTDDAWMYMFTHGQKKRMQAVLSEGGARFGLVNGNNACGKNGNDLELRAPLNDVVKVFPNPSNGPTTIEVTSEIKGPATLEIYNPFGQLMYRSEIELIAGVNHKFLNAGAWAAGIYTIHLVRDRYTMNQKFIRN